MKIGKNKAIELIRYIPFYDLYVNNLKTANEIENFNYEGLVDYLAELEIPFNILKDFFDENLDFCDMNGNATNDEPDYFVMDKDGIYCWTEVLGRTYHLKDYGKTWKELSIDRTNQSLYNNKDSVNCILNKYSYNLALAEKYYEEEAHKELFKDWCKSVITKSLPDLAADENVEVKSVTTFKKDVKK